MRKIIWILFFLVAVCVVITFFRKENTIEIKPNEDFFTHVQATESIKNTLKTSCYDCHSNETKYPVYAKIFPISLVTDHHIQEGREHLNFSTWTSYGADAKKHILKEAIEEIEKDKMPMSSYVLMHQEAKLTESKKKELIDWLKSAQTKIE